MINCRPTPQMPPFFFIYIFLYFVFFLLFCCLLIKRSSRKRSSSRWRSRASAAAPLREPSDLIEVAASFSHSCRHCFIIHAHITQRTLCMHSLYILYMCALIPVREPGSISRQPHPSHIHIHQPIHSSVSTRT